jgi:hypothetical protein
MSRPTPLQGASVWSGAEIARSRRWIKHFPAEVLAEIDAALDRVKDVEWRQVNRGNFPLLNAASFFDDIREELENGSGMVQLRGLDVSRYDELQLRRLWFGLGHHLGTPMYQNRRGEVMRDIRDEGMGTAAQQYGAATDAKGQTFLSSGARTLTSGALRFHTDRCDVVGLLCVRQAAEGGVSKLASSAMVYNRILELTSHYSLTYIEYAQMIPGVRKLSDSEHEAIRLLMATIEAESFEMRFAPGDIQLLNNHAVYHSRTAFKDDAASGQDRLLMRLWLSVPNSRALPEDHAVLWGDVGAGRPRGGIAQPAIVSAA